MVGGWKWRLRAIGKICTRDELIIVEALWIDGRILFRSFTTKKLKVRSPFMPEALKMELLSESKSTSNIFILPV